MKICTACDATYGDETIFCPVDGTTLTPEKKISFDQVPFPYISGSWIEPEAPTESLNHQDSSTHPELPPAAQSSFLQPPPAAQSSFSQPLPNVLQSFLPSPAGSNSNYGPTYATVVAGSMILGLGGLLMIVAQNSPSNIDYPFTMAKSSVNAQVINRSVVTNSAPTNSAGTPETIKPLSRKTDLTGTWKGLFNGMAATFSITTHKGETFSGTLRKNGYLVEFVGQLDYEKASVLITETKVLKTPPNSIWYLGIDNGTVYENGMVMSGTGRDVNGSYVWSFTKQ